MIENSPSPRLGRERMAGAPGQPGRDGVHRPGQRKLAGERRRRPRRADPVPRRFPDRRGHVARPGREDRLGEAADLLARGLRLRQRPEEVAGRSQGSPLARAEVRPHPPRLLEQRALRPVRRGLRRAQQVPGREPARCPQQSSRDRRVRPRGRARRGPLRQLDRDALGPDDRGRARLPPRRDPLREPGHQRQPEGRGRGGAPRPDRRHLPGGGNVPLRPPGGDRPPPLGHRRAPRGRRDVHRVPPQAEQPGEGQGVGLPPGPTSRSP